MSDRLSSIASKLQLYILLQVKISRDGDAFIRDETDGNYTCKWTRTVAGDTMTVVSMSRSI